MNIAVIGTGYVGITTAASLGELGHHIIGVDIDESKIEQLRKGILPIYEPGVEPVIQSLLELGALHFTTSMKEAVQGADILFIAVGTPPLPDGRPDMSYIVDAATEVGQYMTEYKVIVDKSTVPVGTADQVKSIIAQQLKLHNRDIDFDVVSNPEFLQEGKALQDARKPDRIVLGCSSSRSLDMLIKLYEKVEAPKFITSPRSAEMIKYASNGFLATKITFMNELARLCDLLAVDVVEVARGMGLDRRIGTHFLQAGIGYGGSCFPKDVAALEMVGHDAGMEMTILRDVQAINDTQAHWFLERVSECMNGCNGKRITILGLAFKPDTDDVREAPSLKLITGFQNRGAIISGYDPIAGHKIQTMFPNVNIVTDAYQAVTGADAIVVCTEWKEIINLDWHAIKCLMKGNYIFDGRNVLDRTILSMEGYEYWGVGRNLNNK